MEVEIILDRKSKTYLEGENITGIVQLSTLGHVDQKHEGVTLSFNGVATVSNSVLPKNKEG